MKTEINVNRIQLMYPEYIPFDDLCRLLHFSKRKVKWMLDTDWIPHETREQGTWKYRIPTESVIDYLLLREKYPAKYRFPANSFSSRRPPVRSGIPKLTFYQPEEIMSALRTAWSKEPDAISLSALEKLTGYSKERLKLMMSECGGHVLLIGQAVYFNKEEVIHALSKPSSPRLSDYSPAMQKFLIRSIVRKPEVKL